MHVYGTTMGPMTRRTLVRFIYTLASTNGLHAPRATATLAVNYLDRLLSNTAVRPEVWQNVAEVCLSFASKIAHGSSCGIRADLQFEVTLLDSLDWRLVVPTAFSFLPLFAGRFGIGTKELKRAGVRVQLFTMRRLAFSLVALRKFFE